MMCPAGKVGLIIGKGGEKIRELMQRTGTHIKVVQDQSTMGAPSKPVIITGDTQSQVDEARRLIEEIVDLPDDGVCVPSFPFDTFF
jgi:polyribonucleotide nucleotidyltransferase